jgi:hypothetical protein
MDCRVPLRPKCHMRPSTRHRRLQINGRHVQRMRLRNARVAAARAVARGTGTVISRPRLRVCGHDEMPLCRAAHSCWCTVVLADGDDVRGGSHSQVACGQITRGPMAERLPGGGGTEISPASSTHRHTKHPFSSLPRPTLSLFNTFAHARHAAAQPAYTPRLALALALALTHARHSNTRRNNGPPHALRPADAAQARRTLDQRPRYGLHQPVAQCKGTASEWGCSCCKQEGGVMDLALTGRRFRTLPRYASA